MEQETLFDLGPDWVGFDKDVRDVLGRGRPGDEAQRVALDVAGASPERVVVPKSLAQVSELVRAIVKRGLCVVPLGLGAHAATAGPPDRPFVALCLSELKRIVDFQPSNMTLTIEGGATLEAVQATAARGGQWLPLDPPLEGRTTIGGLIAANLSGPARFSQGTVRDLLIGVKVVAADGTIVQGGGRVVKNVAGYDLPKLYCGSEGTLGIIVEATFKLRPRPEEFKILQLRCGSAPQTQEVLTRLVGSRLEPSFVELLSFVPLGDVGYNIVVGCFGATEQVSYQARQMKAILGDKDPAQELSGEEAHAAMQELRDFRVAGNNALRVKVSLLPTKVMPFVRKLENEGTRNQFRIGLHAHAGNGIVHAKISAVRGVTDNAQVLSGLVERLRGFADELGGSLLVVEASPELRQRVRPWHAPASALMKEIKKKLDPKNVLSPGRFFN